MQPLRPQWVAAPALSVAMYLVSLLFTACSNGNHPAPAQATRPSADARILEDRGLLSNGSPVPPYITTTVQTSRELLSDGLIGGLSADGEGNLYCADLGSHIWKIAPDGTSTLLSAEFEDPSGNLALASGELLQSEWTRNRIYRIADDGSRSLFSERNLDGPVAIAQHPDGDFIVANSRGAYLARVPRGGGDATIVLRDERISQPNGVVVDGAGTAYIADLDSGHVFRWTAAGDLSSLAELPGSGNAHIAMAQGMLYVTKIWDHVVYRVDPQTGTYGIVSGTGRAGYKDGIRGVASVEEPNAIVASADGESLYFNTHRGRMGRGESAQMVIRRLRSAP